MDNNLLQIQTLFMSILLGGILGMTGQAIRMIIGIKKENDVLNEKARASGATTVSYYDSLSGKRLTISLLIGFVAGVLAFLFLGDGVQVTFTKPNVLAIIASGYSGVDFIEGLINRYLPDTTPRQPLSTPTAALPLAPALELGPNLPPVPAR